MIKYVEFWGLTDRGRRYYGRILLENGTFRVQGGRLVKAVLDWRVRDPRPEGNHRWITKEDGEVFLRTLPLYICGCRLCASRVKKLQVHR